MAEEAINYEVEDAEEWGKITPPEKSEKVAVEYEIEGEEDTTNEKVELAPEQKEATTKEPLEKQLWKTADKLRKNIDAAEYKHIVLGLIFLKYISDAFEELYAKLKVEEENGADPEDKDEYKAENVFFVPQDARWHYLQSKAKQPEIGKFVDSTR